MIKQIRIRNFALAEELDVTFRSGLNILTGETGAGKSILVGAIAAVLGNRVYTEVVRTGADRAQVEAIIDIAQLPELRRMLASRGIDVRDELIIRRDIPVRGSSRAFLNDVSVTISSLAEIGEYLVDIHGQHEHQRLLKKETHRIFLDALGRNSQALAAVKAAFVHVKQVEQELAQLRRRQRELEEKKELYHFQHQEIEKAALKDEENIQLESERRILANTSRLFELAAQLGELFESDGGGILRSNGLAGQKIAELGGYSAQLKKLSDEYEGARIVIEETARSIEEFQSRLEFDPQRLEEVEQRLDLIQRLKKKYGETITDILAYQQNIKKLLDQSDDFDREVAALTEKHSSAVAAYARTAESLSNRRRKIAKDMQNRVARELEKLGMPRLQFRVRMDLVPDPSGLYAVKEQRYFGDESGIDAVEFDISSNPGEDFKPLSKIASGGEISRIMLALKRILAEIDEIPSLIFDEIDSGVSGRIAQAVGRSIFELSASHQIFCITHLPQIAAYGDTHFNVEKYVESDRTYTRISPIDGEERVAAVARLMAGEELTPSVMESARQLIEAVRQ